MEITQQYSPIVDQNAINKTLQELSQYTNTLRDATKDLDYTYPESSLYVPFDMTHLGRVREVANTLINPSLKYVFIIGIGGSNLGTKALYDALYGYFDVFEDRRFPKMLFIDTCDPAQLTMSTSILSSLKDNPESFAVILVSKSGTTTESLFNFEALGTSIPFDVLKSRLVVLTMEGTKLWNHAQDNGIRTLSLPLSVGGRYSVFTAVGTLPLLCIGVDVENLLQGARDITTQSILAEDGEDHAKLTASILYEHMNNNVDIHDMFFFHPELESMGKWYRQLFAESLGKDGKGMLPTVTIGSTDLHSMLQLYIGGVRNRLTTFVSPKESHMQDVTLGSQMIFPNVIDEINNKSASEIMWAIYEGVKIEYKDNGLPYIEVRLENLSPYELGKYMQYQMISVMYLGRLMGVNAFDQPNVENYKRETKKILRNY